MSPAPARDPGTGRRGDRDDAVGQAKVRGASNRSPRGARGLTEIVAAVEQVEQRARVTRAAQGTAGVTEQLGAQASRS